MKEIEFNEKYNFSGDYKNVIDNVRDNLMRMNFKIAGETKISEGYSFHAKRGSQVKLRLLGGALISRNSLPIKLNLKIMKDKSVFLEVSSDVGFGSSFGMKDRLKLTMMEVGESVRDILK